MQDVSPGADPGRSAQEDSSQVGDNRRRGVFFGRFFVFRKPGRRGSHAGQQNRRASEGLATEDGGGSNPLSGRVYFARVGRAVSAGQADFARASQRTRSLFPPRRGWR